MSTAFRTDVLQLGASVALRMGSADPTSGGGVAAAIDSLYFQTSTSLLWQKMGAGATDWRYLQPQDVYGDGSDGAGVIAAGTTTLPKNMFYTSLTVQSGGILDPAGYRIFVRGDLVVDAGGLITANGANAVTVTGGAAGGATGAFAQPGSAGGNGGNFGIGSSGGTLTSALTGAVNRGGSGGNGSGGVGGAGGVLTVTTANIMGNPRSLVQACLASEVGGNTVGRMAGGTGGGGGGGTGAAQGGGGGGGAGCIAIFARTITNNGGIEAKGGNGAQCPTVNGGGGGGGGGGNIITLTRFYGGTAADVSPGAPGAANGGSGLVGLIGVIGNRISVQG